MLNNTLREVRKKIGLSVTELSRRSGVSRVHIHNIESNVTKPSAEVAIRLAKAMDKDLHDIFFVDSVNHETQVVNKE